VTTEDVEFIRRKAGLSPEAMARAVSISELDEGMRLLQIAYLLRSNDWPAKARALVDAGVAGGRKRKQAEAPA
jgi:hypothetical protein